MLPTDDGIEKVSIEEFQVALVAGQLMLTTSVNPWWTIPVAVAIVALKAAGVVITTATLKAATILIAAGKKVTARIVHVVVSSWPRIEAALIRAGRAVGLWTVGGASYDWVQGNCILKKNKKQIDNLAYRAKQALKTVLERRGSWLCELMRNNLNTSFRCMKLAK